MLKRLFPQKSQPTQSHKTSKQIHGALGETTAAVFLTSQGYTIVEKNFKKRYGEIDIVALEGNTLVFVEVKTRYSRMYGLPEEAVTPRKVKTLIRSAYYYQLEHPEFPSDFRIDVVAIEMNEDHSTADIRLIRNISL